VGSSMAFAIAGALYSTSQLRYMRLFEGQGFDVSAVKRMASAAGFRYALTVALVIACVGVLASLFRGPGENKGLHAAGPYEP